MYLLLAIVLPLFIILLFINHRRRKRIIEKVCGMCIKDKCELLNTLLEPFGYYYISSQDIFTSRIDSWQREFGYSAFYDEAAHHFGMIFDNLPVYFNYQGRTWLLEFWKGQYGINTGCEIGLYYTDRILEEKEYRTALFQSAGNRDMIKMSFSLYRRDVLLTQLAAKHWWLTAFCMGYFSKPYELTLRASVTFPSSEMARAFANGLISTGYSSRNICFRCCTVTFIFGSSSQSTGILRKRRIDLAQMINRAGCKLFLFITRPFHSSMDRVLYLYYYLPFIFRRMVQIRKYTGKQRRAKQLT